MAWVDLDLEACVLFLFDGFALLLFAMGSPDHFVVVGNEEGIHGCQS
jgi:hypothetical protein